MNPWDKIKQQEEIRKRRIRKITSLLMGIGLGIAFLFLIWSMIK